MTEERNNEYIGGKPQQILHQMRINVRSGICLLTSQGRPAAFLHATVRPLRLNSIFLPTFEAKRLPRKRCEHLPPLECIWFWRPRRRHVISACLSVHSDCQSPSDGNQVLPFRKTQHTHACPNHMSSVLKA